MRLAGKLVAWIFLTIAAIWLLAPVDRVDRTISFDPKQLPDNLDNYLQSSEQQYPDIVPGTAKGIFWAGVKGRKTPISVIYIHGFSATSKEIHPVPDEVAKALGANLFYTRLAGHGRGFAPMAEVTAGDWIEDMAEAMAIGRRLGDRVIVIATSTGATLAALGATDPTLGQGMAGLVLISPNFGLNNRAAMILDLPLARWWGPLVAGRTLSFEARNADHARYWTLSYPTTALFPMAALMREARAADYSAVRIPALFLYSPQDQVISTTALAPVIAAWGGPTQVEQRSMQAGDDPHSHVIAGDIQSPGQTEPVIAIITAWVKTL